MEDLFTTSIAVNNRNVIYKVIFDKEQYVFISQEEIGEHGRFAFIRTHDEWVGQDEVPMGIRKQAIDALERYLLKQH